MVGQPRHDHPRSGDFPLATALDPRAVRSALISMIPLELSQLQWEQLAALALGVYDTTDVIVERDTN